MEERMTSVSRSREPLAKWPKRGSRDARQKRQLGCAASLAKRRGVWLSSAALSDAPVCLSKRRPLTCSCSVLRFAGHKVGLVLFEFVLNLRQNLRMILSDINFFTGIAP